MCIKLVKFVCVCVICDVYVHVCNAYRQELFILRAILLWTIHDFSPYDNLPGYGVKEHKASPICGEDTFSVPLRHEKKIVYLGTRRLLPMSHYYQRLQKAFNWSTEEEETLKTLNGEQVYERVKHLKPNCEKVK